MKFYHRTKSDNASKILKRGFKDTTGSYGFVSITLTGVWVSNQILDENEGACGDTVLQIVVKNPTKELKKYEVIEDGRPFREWCIPARLLNQGKVTIHRERMTPAKTVASAGTDDEKQILASIGGERPQTKAENVALGWWMWNIHSPSADDHQKAEALRRIEDNTRAFIHEAMQKWNPGMLRDLAKEMAALTEKGRETDKPLLLLLAAKKLGPVNVSALHKYGVKNEGLKISLRHFQAMAKRHNIPTLPRGRQKKQSAV